MKKILFIKFISEIELESRNLNFKNVSVIHVFFSLQKSFHKISKYKLNRYYLLSFALSGT